MLFLIHAGCGFGCGVLIMHVLTVSGRPHCAGGAQERRADAIWSKWRGANKFTFVDWKFGDLDRQRVGTGAAED
jgi:hypothetical protein